VTAREIPDSGEELYGLLQEASHRAHPSWRRLDTTHWVMGPAWYMAIRRVSVAHLPDDDEARDESKWEPDPGDAVLGYGITVTEDGGEPHLADGRPDAGFYARARSFADRSR
jgi:hypothetical protein